MSNYELTHLYQPIVDMTDLRLVRHEALLRVEGITDIQAFTREMEASGKIIELDLHTLDTVLRRLEGRDAKVTVPIALNLSGMSISSPRFQAQALEMLAQRPSALDVSIEITESSPIVDMELARDFVRKIQQIGGTVGMDDYGDGFAYLGMVNELHLDYLKLSSTLTRCVLDSPRSLEKINVALHYAQERGIDVVAEHVDNIPQYLLLRDLGIQHGQGWLFAKAQRLIEDHDRFHAALKRRIEEAINHPS